MLDNNLDKEEYEKLEYEPEWCEQCSNEMEREGIAYTFDYYIEDGQAICEHCGMLL